VAKHRELTEEEEHRVLLKEMVYSPYWQAWDNELVKEEQAIQREWPDAKDVGLHQLQGMMQLIQRWRELPKRLDTDKVQKEE